jgi:hypothetical protein
VTIIHFGLNRDRFSPKKISQGESTTVVAKSKIKDKNNLLIKNN